MYSIFWSDIKGTKYYNQTAVFALNIGDKKINPSDDIESVTAYNSLQLQELINSYNTVGKDLKIIEGEHEFYWVDYAKMYAPIHQVVLDSTYAETLPPLNYQNRPEPLYLMSM